MGNLSRIIPVDRVGPGLGTAPPFERIAIVGFGLIGGSIALAIRERWQAGLLIAIDRKDVLESAMRRHAVDVGGDDLVMAGDADLIVLAAPVLHNIKTIERLPEYVAGEAVVTDVGSTKQAIADAARKLPERLRFIGGHPLAGAATGGLDAARADLFADRPWILTPSADTPTAQLERLEGLISGLGGRPTRMAAADHDRLLAYLSHLPQLAVTALMRVVGERAGAEGLALSGRGLADTTRLASSPANIWTDICATNAGPVGDALDALIDALQQLRGGLARQDVIERAFAAANEWKRRMPVRGEQ
jgi:prephenate dehydrogenase